MSKQLFFNKETGSSTSIDKAAIFWPVALFNIPLQIFTTQIHNHGEVRRGEKGGGGKDAESLSSETIVAEWTAAQWGRTPQVGNATLGGPNPCTVEAKDIT